MSSRLNAPEASPVVAYRYSAALNTPEQAAPIAMQGADRDDRGAAMPTDRDRRGDQPADQHHRDRRCRKTASPIVALPMNCSPQRSRKI